MSLRIGLLGPLIIEEGAGKYRNRFDGWISKKGRALLAYLAAQQGESVSRERLADLLWPDQGSEQARHSLRNCFLELRKTLGPPASAAHLQIDFVRCQLTGADVDLDEFNSLAVYPGAAPTDLVAVAALYRGEFLDELNFPSEPWEEWLMEQRASTLARVCDALYHLSEQQSAQGQHEAAVATARRLMHLDPLTERGCRILMRALAHSGRRSEALRQFADTARLLRRELGVEPDEQTQALTREIRQAAPATEEPAPVTERPLVAPRAMGIAAELRQLNRDLTERLSRPRDESKRPGLRALLDDINLTMLRAADEIDGGDLTDASARRRHVVENAVEAA